MESIIIKTKYVINIALITSLITIMILIASIIVEAQIIPSAFSILGGSTPDIVVMKQWTSSKCSGDSCTFDHVNEIGEDGVPVWNSGMHTLKIKPLLSITEQQYNSDPRTKLEVFLDGKKYVVKDQESITFNSYLTVFFDIHAEIETYAVFPEVTNTFGKPIDQRAGFRQRITGMRINMNVYLDPDKNGNVQYSGEGSISFKSNPTIPFTFSTVSPGLKWAMLSTDSSIGFFTGTKASVTPAGIITSTSTLNIPVNTFELGKRTVTMHPAIESTIYSIANNDVLQSGILTKSSRGLEVNIDIEPVVQGQARVEGIPIQAREIQTVKKTYEGTNDAINSLSGASSLKISFVIIGLILIFMLVRKVL